MRLEAKLKAKFRKLRGRFGISGPSSLSETTTLESDTLPTTPTEGATSQAEPLATAAHSSGEGAIGAPPVLPSPPEVHALVEQAKEEFDRANRIGAKTGNAVEQVPNQWEAAETTVKLWSEVVSKIAIFTAVADEIGKTHPYVGAVTSVITSIVKPIERQHARDDAFEKLLSEMIRTYDLVKKELYQDATRLKKPANFQTKLLLKMSAESENCARFIKDEYIAKNFWPRAMKNAFRGGEVDKRIEEFRNNFADCRESWRDEQVTYIKESTMLDKLARVNNGGPLTQKSCLPDTRVGLLRELQDWLDDENGSRARYLVGVAGSGKSSIAHTIAVAMQGKDRLGSFFAFDRSETDRGPERVLGTIAYDLALINEDYRDALIRVLRDKPKLADSTDIDDQWNMLIIGPCDTLSLDESLLIVIDAFDECTETPGDPFRRSLLKYLTAGVAQLPSRLRVLVTSRAEADIVQAMCPDNRLDIADFMASEDIRIFIHDRLFRPDGGGLNAVECADLVEAADGLFQWAATASRFLTQRLAGTTIRERFNTYRAQLTKGDLRLEGGRPSLCELYQTVLAATFDTEMEGAMSRFRVIVALMLSAKSLLSIDDLQLICDLAEGNGALQVKDVLAHMGVVLEGTSTTFSPVRPMHTSFRDFLFDDSRSHAWIIRLEDLRQGHAIMALGTVRLLNQDLTFNMCDLPSSDVDNGDVPDLALRLSRISAA